jgi:hypothetical protein
LKDPKFKPGDEVVYTRGSKKWMGATFKVIRYDPVRIRIDNLLVKISILEDFVLDKVTYPKGMLLIFDEWKLELIKSPKDPDQQLELF